MDTLARERTIADRQSFILSEMAIETAAQLAENLKPEEIKPIDTSGVVDKRWEEKRNNMAMREAAVKFKAEMFAKVLGEMVYQAIPFDEHEKASIHESVIDSTVEMMSHLSDWKLSEAGLDIADSVSDIVDTEGVDVTVATVIKHPSLFDSIKSIASVVEGRVVSAVVNVRAKAAMSESAIAIMTEECNGDKELLESRIRRHQKANPPSLIESLYAATSKSLTEQSGQKEVPQDIIMGEAVTLYTMMETLSAIGIMSVTREEVDLISKALIKA